MSAAMRRECYAAGQLAHAQARPDAPGADATVRQYIAGRLVGDPETLALMRAFSEGYQAERDTETDRRIMGSDAAVAIGRFSPDGPRGYVARSAPGAPVRDTRADAGEDERRWLEHGETNAPTCHRCGVALELRPTQPQTPEQLATGPWWDHPPIAGQVGLFGHTVSSTSYAGRRRADA